MRLRLYAKTLNMHTFWSPGWKVAKYVMCKYATLHYVQLKVKNKLKAVLKFRTAFKTQNNSTNRRQSAIL